jgi:hypothetical protein
LTLTTPLPLLTDYRYIPSSLTRLELQLGNDVKWSFDNENGTEMGRHLPHLIDLELEIGSNAKQWLKNGALSKC